MTGHSAEALLDTWYSDIQPALDSLQDIRERDAEEDPEGAAEDTPLEPVKEAFELGLVALKEREARWVSYLHALCAHVASATLPEPEPKIRTLAGKIETELKQLEGVRG